MELAVGNLVDYRVTTELTAGNLMWFAEKALLGGFSAEELYTCTMPYVGANVYSSTYGTNLSYVIPQAEELLAEVNGHFNPYETEVTMDNLDLMRLDGGGGAYPSGGTDREFVAEVCQRHNIHRTTAYSDLAVVKSLLPMLGSASRDFHRWRTNEMLIATYKMAEKRRWCI